jgi:hypothetical protein
MYLAYNNVIVSEKERMVLAKICYYFWRYAFRNVHKKDELKRVYLFVSAQRAIWISSEFNRFLHVTWETFVAWVDLK